MIQGTCHKCGKPIEEGEPYARIDAWAYCESCGEEVPYHYQHTSIIDGKPKFIIHTGNQNFGEVFDYETIEDYIETAFPDLPENDKFALGVMTASHLLDSSIETLQFLRYNIPVVHPYDAGMMEELRRASELLKKYFEAGKDSVPEDPEETGAS